MTFYLPMSTGEWLAWLSGVVTVLFGLAFLFAPRPALHLLGLNTHDAGRQDLAPARATLAGFHLGVGLIALLFAQPFLWMALGAGWGFAAFGRLVSMLVDHGLTVRNGVLIVIEIVLAALPLGYVFGYL